MIEVLVAFVFGMIPGLFAAFAIWHNAKLDRADYWRNYEKLMDRVQSPDLTAYYGARAAYHPDDFPAEPEQEFSYDDFGFVQDERRPEDKLPGEMTE